jgi:hypothetical protein
MSADNTGEMQRFNAAMSSLRICVENWFAILFNQFK